MFSRVEISRVGSGEGSSPAQGSVGFPPGGGLGPFPLLIPPAVIFYIALTLAVLVLCNDFCSFH